MKRLIAPLALLTLGVFHLTAVPSATLAQVSTAPALLSYQGRIATPDGTPVPDGTYAIRFSLWDAVSAGTEKWNQTVANVTVKNGTFAVLLSGFPATTFDGNLWMETQIGTDAPLAPRQQIVSVAYAMKANSVPDASITNAKLADGAVTTAKLAADAINPLAWLLGGNSGTNPASQFFGTSDNQPLVFRTNNAEQMRLLANGRLGIGDTTPGSRLEVIASAAGDGIRVTGTGTGGPQISLFNDNTYGSGLGLALGAGQYSASAAINDTVMRTSLASSKLLLQNGPGAAAISIQNNRVGIGTTTLTNDSVLTVRGLADFETAAFDRIGINTTNPNNRLSVNGNADFTRVGIGKSIPDTPLDVVGRAAISGSLTVSSNSEVDILNINSAQGIGTIMRLNNTSTGGQNWRLISTGSGNANGAGNLVFEGGRAIIFKTNGEIVTNIVTVTGGSDVAEPYHVSPAGDVKPIPGMVVCLDETKIGQMKVAAGAYNTAVAGILSGANGIRPGITLTQKGTVADGDMPVASIGRVWCWCDADANGAIKVGDMLTTSETLGHAMKVTDFGRANGAVVGKAMSTLASGKGLVLVLVSLK